ncbi:MAG: cupin domain-containing protein [Actinomycetota bacterium]|nr:cupin domain-containing protein [Actinomycetota bacterium]
MELDVGQAVLLRSGEGEIITDRPERTLRILADVEQLTLTWFRYEPGEQGPDPHVHRQHSDAFYVLEGELEFALGPDVERIRGAAGTFAAAPPNVVHTFENSSDTTAVFLNIHAPSMGFGDMLRARRDGRTEDAERFDQFDPPKDGGRPLADAVVSHPDEGERFHRGPANLVIKVELPELSLLDLTFAAGWDGVDPHTHDDHVDSFYVLEGELAVLLGEETHRLGPGSFAAALPGTRHGIDNPGPGPVRFLNLHAPDGGFAGRVRGG